MKKILAVSTISIAGAMFANATDYTDITSGRTEVSTDATAMNYKVTAGQLFLNAWNKTDKSYEGNVILAGEGFANGFEPTCALRLNEGATLAGKLEITAGTRIWSSGASGDNTISGAVKQTTGTTVTFLNGGNAGTRNLKFSNSSIAFQTVVLESSASITFTAAATNISFASVAKAESATNTQLKFEEGAKISLVEGQSLTLAADTLTFGSTIISSSTLNLRSTLSSYFTGTAVSAITYQNGALTITAAPEPSAFGLLAGLGALALAGTRRRRR